MNDYYSVRIDMEPCTADMTDLAAAFLADSGFESFEPDATGLTAFIKAGECDGVEVARAALADFPMETEMRFGSEFVEGKDWNEEWEKNYFQPIVIDDACVIHSTFHTDVPKARYEIIIDPKMAFGTGHHDTTSHMVSYLLGGEVRGKSVIDMGTGTGILGILASMLGAEKVTGIEIDEAAYLNAIENVRLNNARMDLIHGDASALTGLEPADILLANINRNIITGDIDRYAARVKKGGRMYLSGFYREDIPIIESAALEQGLRKISERVNNNWAAVELERL